MRWRFGGVGGGRRAVEGKEMRDASESGKVWLPKFSMLECSAGAAGRLERGGSCLQLRKAGGEEHAACVVNNSRAADPEAKRDQLRKGEAE